MPNIPKVKAFKTNYDCGECNRKFSNDIILKIHMKISHTPTKSKEKQFEIHSNSITAEDSKNETSNKKY